MGVFGEYVGLWVPTYVEHVGPTCEPELSWFCSLSENRGGLLSPRPAAPERESRCPPLGALVTLGISGDNEMCVFRLGREDSPPSSVTLGCVTFGIALALSGPQRPSITTGFVKPVLHDYGRSYGLISSLTSSLQGLAPLL